MDIIDNTLKYLRESISNYLDNHDVCKQLYKKLGSKDYQDEVDFVEDLDEEETIYLDSLLKKEINYAEQAQDQFRVKQLNKIYELLL